MMEALRYQTPGAEGSSMYFKQDVRLGNYNIKAYDRIKVSFVGLHFSTSEW
jgi:cytochrome P450